MLGPKHLSGIHMIAATPLCPSVEEQPQTIEIISSAVATVLLWSQSWWQSRFQSNFVTATGLSSNLWRTGRTGTRSEAPTCTTASSTTARTQTQRPSPYSHTTQSFRTTITYIRATSRTVIHHSIGTAARPLESILIPQWKLPTNSIIARSWSQVLNGTTLMNTSFTMVENMEIFGVLNHKVGDLARRQPASMTTRKSLVLALEQIDCLSLYKISRVVVVKVSSLHLHYLFLSFHISI